MSGGIGTCKNQTRMQTNLLLEDGFCTDDGRRAHEPAESAGARP